MPARAQVIGGGAHIHLCPGITSMHEWPCACTDCEWESKECENCRGVREARASGRTGYAADLSDHWG